MCFDTQQRGMANKERTQPLLFFLPFAFPSPFSRKRVSEKQAEAAKRPLIFVLNVRDSLFEWGKN